SLLFGARRTAQWWAGRQPETIKGAFDMNFAAEGGYQAFHLGRTEWFWLFFSVATALLAILVGFGLTRGVLKADQGTAKMREIAQAVPEAAIADRKRQVNTVSTIRVPL